MTEDDLKYRRVLVSQRRKKLRQEAKQLHAEGKVGAAMLKRAEAYGLSYAEHLFGKGFTRLEMDARNVARRAKYRKKAMQS